MSWWVCCCADSTSRDGGVARGQINTVESDYLLPGSTQWDPSRSSSNKSRPWSSLKRSSKNKDNSKKSTVTHSEVGLDSPSGDYQPPLVPPSQKLPSFEEFRLLKTVGRGAFGKVTFQYESNRFFQPTRCWKGQAGA